jgi:nitrogen fixation NifU-like protein
MYQELILDHYRHPHNKGLREPYDAQVHHVNPLCGDEVTLRVALKDAGGEPAVADVSYDALGCSISQASASMMTEALIGKTVGEAMDISGAFLELMQSRGTAEPDEDLLGDAVAFHGVSRYPARVKCALLGWMAWKDATARAIETRATETQATEARATEARATEARATEARAVRTREREQR